MDALWNPLALSLSSTGEPHEFVCRFDGRSMHNNIALRVRKSPSTRTLTHIHVHATKRVHLKWKKECTKMLAQLSNSAVYYNQPKESQMSGETESARSMAIEYIVLGTNLSVSIVDLCIAYTDKMGLEYLDNRHFCKRQSKVERAIPNPDEIWTRRKCELYALVISQWYGCVVRHSITRNGERER